MWLTNGISLRAQSPSSVNKTSQWLLAFVFRHAHPAPQRWYKRRVCLNAHQFSQPRPYSGGTATMATGRYISVPSFRERGLHYNWDVPCQSVTFDVTSVWLTHGIPWKSPLLLTPSSALQKPPHQLRWKIGQGLGRDDRHCCSIQWVWITLRKRTTSRGTLRRPHPSWRRYHVKITHMDWSRAVLHMEVSEVVSASLGWDNYTAEIAESICQGKTRAHCEGSRTVEEYTCGIT